jgi:imidazole glycerol-phosphate synthase subunit HisH
MKKIGIIDYDVGNLFSLENALKYLKFNYVISNDEKILNKCSHIILPGVGAFAPAIKNLKKKKLDKFIKKIVNEGKPLLGICLGMQLLFESSNEFGNCKGLGLIKGSVKKIEFKFSKLPVVGWFKVSVKNKNFINKLNNEYVYLIHSYECLPKDNEIEYSYYTLKKRKKIVCTIKKNNIFAVQFHPEKSHYHGLIVLKNFYDFRKK